MKCLYICSAFLFVCGFLPALGQDMRPDKVSHAEPLYADLVRDLGARAGEKEWNVGLSLEDRRSFHTLSGLVEYEFAPVNRLGVEVEVPFSVHFRTDRKQPADLPQSMVDGIKLAVQYTFFVSKKWNLSLAAGYANGLEFRPEKSDGHMILHPENTSQPFFVAAKSWKTHFHTLLYAAPVMGVDLRTGRMETEWMLNTGFHYVFPRTKNFVGLEVNQAAGREGYSVVCRPQVRVAVSKRLMLGFVTGIPVSSKEEGISTFCRLIYEPGKRVKNKK